MKSIAADMTPIGSKSHILSCKSLSTPFEMNGNRKIAFSSFPIHGDFYENVKKVGDDSIDLIMTDPPFNIATEREFNLEGIATTAPRTLENGTSMMLKPSSDLSSLRGGPMEIASSEIRAPAMSSVHTAMCPTSKRP